MSAPDQAYAFPYTLVTNKKDGSARLIFDDGYSPGAPGFHSCSGNKERLERAALVILRQRDASGLLPEPLPRRPLSQLEADNWPQIERAYYGAPS